VFGSLSNLIVARLHHTGSGREGDCRSRTKQELTDQAVCDLKTDDVLHRSPRRHPISPICHLAVVAVTTTSRRTTSLTAQTQGAPAFLRPYYCCALPHAVNLSRTSGAHGIACRPAPSPSIVRAWSDVPRPGLAALGRRRGRENAPRGTGLRAPIAYTNTWPTAPLTHHRASARPSPKLPSASTPSPSSLPQRHRAAADQHGPLFARHCRVKVLRPDLRPWRAQSRKGHGALRHSIPPAGAYIPNSHILPRASIPITTTLFICRDAELD
jgi:hypothetical protein